MECSSSLYAKEHVYYVVQIYALRNTTPRNVVACSEYKAMKPVWSDPTYLMFILLMKYMILGSLCRQKLPQDGIFRYLWRTKIQCLCESSSYLETKSHCTGYKFSQFKDRSATSLLLAPHQSPSNSLPSFLFSAAFTEARENILDKMFQNVWWHFLVHTCSH